MLLAVRRGSTWGGEPEIERAKICGVVESGEMKGWIPRKNGSTKEWTVVAGAEMKAVWNPSPRATSTSLGFSGMFASPPRKLGGEYDRGKEERSFSPTSPRDFVNSVNRQGLKPSHLETRRYQ